MTQQDARSLQAGDKITDGRKVYRVQADFFGLAVARAPHERTREFQVNDLKRFQRMPESTRKGRRNS